MTYNGPKRRPAKNVRKAKPKAKGKKGKGKTKARMPKFTLADKSSGAMVRNPGNGAQSQSAFTHRIKASRQVRSMETVGAPNIGYSNSVANIQTAGGGQQAYAEFYINSAASVQAVASHIPTGTAGGVPPYRFVLEESMDTFHMSNGTSGTLEVDIYDIFPRKDIAQISEYNPLGATAPYPLVGGVLSYWQQGARSQAALAPSTTTLGPADFYQVSLMDSRLVQNYFRIAKRTRVFLPQGAAHKHTVLRHVNQLIDSTEFSMTGTGTAPVFSQYKRYSSQVLIVVRGAPVAVEPPGGATAVVSTGLGLLNVVQTTRQKWTYVNDQSYNNYYANNLISSGTQTNINPATGAVASVTQLII